MPKMSPSQVREQRAIREFRAEEAANISNEAAGNSVNSPTRQGDFLQSRANVNTSKPGTGSTVQPGSNGLVTGGILAITGKTTADRVKKATGK